MKSIPLSQGKFAVVDDELFDVLNQWIWSYDGTYAVRCGVNGNHILMHDYIMQPPEGMEVDHVNRYDKLNNCKSNLRICTHSQNMANSRLRVKSASGYRGVTAHQGRWKAQIMCMYKNVYVGSFESAIEAARAYDRKAVELFGEFAVLNFPKEVLHES